MDRHNWVQWEISLYQIPNSIQPQWETIFPLLECILCTIRLSHMGQSIIRTIPFFVDKQKFTIIKQIFWNSLFLFSFFETLPSVSSSCIFVLDPLHSWKTFYSVPTPWTSFLSFFSYLVKPQDLNLVQPLELHLSLPCLVKPHESNLVQPLEPYLSSFLSYPVKPWLEFFILHYSRGVKMGSWVIAWVRPYNSIYFNNQL